MRLESSETEQCSRAIGRRTQCAIVSNPGLVAYVSTHPEYNSGGVRGLAGVLFPQPGSSGIRSIQLAKNSVVTHIYPLKGNEAALGLTSA